MLTINPGVVVHSIQSVESKNSHDWFEDLLHQSSFSPWVKVSKEPPAQDSVTRYQLNQEGKAKHTPENNTLQLAHLESLWKIDWKKALTEEILLGLLTSPYPQVFPSYDELCSAVRLRQFIAEAAKLTALKFDTRAVDRPMTHWTYDEERGFMLRSNCSLIEALKLATQPAYSGSEYSFSCYRATEYVILLGVAQEAKICNPIFFKQLHQQWEKKAIASGAFHDTFLVEHGSLTQPVPMFHYIPGDRVWFRNPDAQSSNVSGYEGSWVIYLGNGFFSNFWSNNQPFSLMDKCLEVYHWRDGAYLDEAGVWCMDESMVSSKVLKSKSEPESIKNILYQMRRYRDPSGVYDQGGCIDASRESPRFIRPATCNMVLRDL